MKSLNKIQLIGFLGNAPESRNAGDSTVTNFSVATSERWKDNNGEIQETTQWHQIEAWNGLGSVAGDYLKKGSRVFVEGSLRYSTYKAEGGHEREVAQIRASNIIFLDGKE